MSGSSAPVMYWAIRTTLCSAMRLDDKQLPYQALMQPVKMLSVVHLLHLLSLLHLPSLHLHRAQEEREPAGQHRAIITYSYINRTYINYKDIIQNLCTHAHKHTHTHTQTNTNTHTHTQTGTHHLVGSCSLSWVMHRS
jgi:hypothetical protein